MGLSSCGQLDLIDIIEECENESKTKILQNNIASKRNIEKVLPEKLGCCKILFKTRAGYIRLGSIT